MWKAFTGWYGQKFVANFGTTPLETWSWGLADVTPEEFRYGLDAVKAMGREWPPSCPEFRALCKARGDGEMMAGRMPPSRALPVSDEVWEKRKARAAIEIAKCREILSR